MHVGIVHTAAAAAAAAELAVWGYEVHPSQQTQPHRVPGSCPPQRRKGLQLGEDR